MSWCQSCPWCFPQLLPMKPNNERFCDVERGGKNIPIFMLLQQLSIDCLLFRSLYTSILTRVTAASTIVRFWQLSQYHLTHVVSFMTGLPAHPYRYFIQEVGWIHRRGLTNDWNLVLIAPLFIFINDCLTFQMGDNMVTAVNGVAEIPTVGLLVRLDR